MTRQRIFISFLLDFDRNLLWQNLSSIELLSCAFVHRNRIDDRWLLKTDPIHLCLSHFNVSCLAFGASQYYRQNLNREKDEQQTTSTAKMTSDLSISLYSFQFIVAAFIILSFESSLNETLFCFTNNNIKIVEVNGRREKNVVSEEVARNRMDFQYIRQRKRIRIKLHYRLLCDTKSENNQRSVKLLTIEPFGSVRNRFYANFAAENASVSRTLRTMCRLPRAQATGCCASKHDNWIELPYVCRSNGKTIQFIWNKEKELLFHLVLYSSVCWTQWRWCGGGSHFIPLAYSTIRK